MSDSEVSYHCELQSSAGEAVSFPVNHGQSVVKAAAKAGYVLTTGCLQGRCAICRARLISGHVTRLRRASKHATANPAERADGCVLLCSVTAQSDLVVAPLSPWHTTTTE